MRHFQQGFAFTHQAHTRRVVDLAATALGHPVDEIQHIGPACSGEFFAFFAVVQMLFVIDVFEPLGEQGQRRFSPLGVAGTELQIIDLVAKGLQAPHGFGGQDRAQRVAEHRFKQADAVLVGKLAEFLQGGVADAAFGRGDAAQKRRVVVVVHPQAQPCTQIANLGAVEKTLPTRHLVGNGGFAKGFLQYAGLVVGAVKHREMFPVAELAHALACVVATAQALDAVDQPFSLVFFVVRVHHPHRFACTQVAEQCLGEQLGVGADHIVGRLQDGAGGAVVLLQLHHLQVGEVLGQTL